ncbi:lipoate--protein ligase family protein [Paludisphaera sp.]|uniref:lipoate--protein ligase family protein n=1 Tax=Paludisphaera sp. TaxID=2017432 RepID=UPI00301E0C1E
MPLQDPDLLTLQSVHDNLALDEAILVEADEESLGPILRFWEQPDYAVVLGSSRRLNDEVHVDRCREDGATIARRASGGGTVVIGPGALNVTVVLPTEHAPPLATVEGAQGYVLGVVAEALRAREPGVEVRGSGDLVVGDRKFSGSAQRRLRRRVMVHATIMYDFTIARIARYLQTPSRQPAYRGGRTHEEFLRNIPLRRRILIESIRSAWSHSTVLTATSILPQDRLETLRAERFGNRSWIERL